jgi:starch synthase
MIDSKQPIAILMATAEVAPFSKVGGLGDVLGALPQALQNQNVEARVISPLYGRIDRKASEIEPMPGVGPVTIQAGDTQYEIHYKRATMPGSGTIVYFVDCDVLFNRPGIYSDPVSALGYPDNATRYIVFSRAIVEFLRVGDFRPDILHLNDNQTALVAPMLKTIPQYKDLATIPVLMSIHNAEYQGAYDQRFISVAGLDPALAYPGGPFEFYGGFNFLKAGIAYADKLSTVSPTYAEETMSSASAGFGLEGLLASRRVDYVGIINGVNYSVWNPETDPLIPKNYSAKTLDDKRVNKKALLARCGFSEDLDKPIIGIISRLVFQKGIDLVIDSLPQFLAPDVRLVVLGSGEPAYHHQLNEARKRYPDRLSVNITFDDQLAHLIEAGSDMFLMPSRFEPCGLNQLYSLKYGTIPVVRRTGGLADTVHDYQQEEDSGWGFVFGGFTPFDLAYAINRAKETYYSKSEWEKLQRRGMELDFSWTTSAAHYRRLYAGMIGIADE